jgi:hypothetical protein
MSFHDQIKADRDAALPDVAEIKTYRNYVKGKQRGTLTVQQERILRGLLGKNYCDNASKKALEAMTNRLDLTRFDVANPSVARWLADWWVTAQLADFSTDVHRATFRDGSHYGALRWDNARRRVTVHRERAWDGISGMYVHYGEDGQPLYAVKEWKAVEGLRRTLYHPHVIERWIADGDGWKPYALPGETSWMSPWVRPDGRPIGIPVVHFANVSMDDLPHGDSFLAGGLLGAQDDINDAQRDLSAAARLTGYLAFWATGVDLAKDANGNPIPLQLAPGAFFHSPRPDSRFGSLPAGDLSQLINNLHEKLYTFARNSSVPVHMITGGDWPSGEALLRAEQPLVDLVRNCAKRVGPAWASLAHKAVVLANVFGLEGLDEDAMITAVFAAPERRDLLTLGPVAASVAPYLSQRAILRMLGYSPTEVEQIMAERDQEAAQINARATPQAYGVNAAMAQPPATQDAADANA